MPLQPSLHRGVEWWRLPAHIQIMQRPFVHPAIEDISLEGLLYALADPARLEIVKTLSDRDCPLNCSAAAPDNLPKSTQSHHYQILREAGLIRSERRGTQVVNTLRCDELDVRFPGVLSSVLRAASAHCPTTRGGS